MYEHQFVLENFRNYYYQLTKQLDRLLELDELSSTEGAVVEIQNELLNFINTQIQKIDSVYDGIDRKLLRKGIYLQTALSDELFLKSDWKGKEIWKQSMLEHRVFNTQHAGDQVFKDIEDIIANPFKTSKALIALYLLVLSLGFEGKMSTESIATYKKYLHKILYPTEDDSVFINFNLPLIPQNFNFTIEQKPVGYVPNVKTWGLICAGGLACYVLATSFYWFNIQSDIKRVSMQLKQKTQIGKSLR